MKQQLMYFRSFSCCFDDYRINSNNNNKGNIMHSSSRGFGLGIVVLVVIVMGIITFLTKL
jgi:hypothetical protein